MEERKVSIIIPVFNAKKNLVQCVHSVMSQTYKNIQIILVDDGSTDNSNSLCNKLSCEDQRIKVIHQENQGVSMARNKGIDNADGFYIQFVDSDDFVLPTMTEVLVGLLENSKAELGICGYNFINRNKNEIVPFVSDYNLYPTKTFIIEKFLKHLGYYMIYFNNICMPWNKIYILDIIKKHKLHFDKDIEYGEDLIFNISYLRNCKKITVSTELLYHYVIENANSLEGKYKENLFQIQINQYEKILKIVTDYNVYGECNCRNLSSFFLERIIYCIRMLYHRDCKMNDIEKITYLTEVLDNKSVSHAIKHRAFNLNGWLAYIPQLILEKKYDKLHMLFYDESEGKRANCNEYTFTNSNLYTKLIKQISMFIEIKEVYGYAIALDKTIKKYRS